MLKSVLRLTAAVAIGVVLCACATPGPVPATTQPALSKLALSYADDMRKVGIHSVMVYGNGARVRVATRLGDIYFHYPVGLAQTDFVVYLDTSGAEVDSDTLSASNSAQYEAAIKVILPEAIKWTTANNVSQFEQGLGGGGGRGR